MSITPQDVLRSSDVYVQLITPQDFEQLRHDFERDAMMIRYAIPFPRCGIVKKKKLHDYCGCQDDLRTSEVAKIISFANLTSTRQDDSPLNTHERNCEATTIICIQKHTSPKFAADSSNSQQAAQS